MTLLNVAGNFFSERGYQSVVTALESRKQLVAAGLAPSLQIQVPVRTRSVLYEQVHQLNQALAGKGKKKK
ncbi:hypothetical protein HDU91_001778 [Kappamyces sp. JEL0680]|nr:hypothetical protein HDU91_001778 [Kappamyces sp. JEL0680]